MTARGAERPSTRLRYNAPARDWEREALPIGNGRLGAMILGEPGATRLALNVASLWTGGANPSGAYDDDGFGNYQALGNLHVQLDDASPFDDYERTLDLERALHGVTFSLGDAARCEEEAFASAPDGVLVYRFSTARAGGVTGRVELEGRHDETTHSGGAELWFEGALPNGLRYFTALRFVVLGGEVESDGNALRFRGARGFVVVLAADTDYALAPAAEFRGPAPEPSVRAALARAVELGVDRLRERHVADHGALFSRVDLELGREGELHERLFHYGRYLLIASARPGGLPPNLQGLWNDSNQPPWHCDYHTNVNEQMCLWSAEPAALPECHEPLFALLDGMLPACRAATRAELGADAPGFAYRTSHNIFGGQGWEWNLPANAWFALHYWEHFAFSLDREFLRARAYPYLREACEFWLWRLVPDANGALVAPGGWSPEHGPVEAAVTYDHALIAELFDVTLEAAGLLGLEDPLHGRVKMALERLVPPRRGRFGQLQEWAVDRDDPDDRHRHTSHLVGVYPGRRISVERTPELARAAAVSLRSRGDTDDSRRSWTWPWRALLWARLGSRADTHRMLDGYVEHNLLPNLLATHPPLQLDGSLAFPAAVAEMLVQSHAGVVELLPGLDLQRWPRGAFRGLRARGAFEVSARWGPGGVEDATLRSLAGSTVTVAAEPAPRLAEDSRGRVIATRADSERRLVFATEAHESYRLRFG